MRDNEKKIAATRQQQKNSVTAGLLVTAQEQADQETALVQSAREYLNDKHGLDQFPLLLDMYWKMQAGMEVNPEVESNRWFSWANQALGGFGSHIPRPLRKRVAFELCQATYEDLQKPETVEEIDLVIAAAKKEKKVKASPPPWSYEKGQVIMSLIGNEPFTPEMIDAINQVKFKIKNKDTGESADVLAKVKSYQISGVLRPQQEDMGLKREVILTVQIANGYEEKFFNAIKKKCKGFKVARLDAFRSPCTQGKMMVQAAAKELLADTINDFKLDLGVTLLASAVASEVENADSEFHGMRNLFVRPQEDIVENVKAEAHSHGLDLNNYIDRAWVDEVEAFVNKAWEGMVTLEDLYEHDEHAAHGLIMQSVGHGVSHTDDPEVVDWLKGKGLTDQEIKLKLPYGEEPYDKAYEFLLEIQGDMKDTVNASLYPALAKILITAMTDDEILADIQQQFPGHEEEIKDSFKRGDSQWGADSDDVGSFKQDGEEWCFITSEEEAHKLAVEHVEQMLEDEPELFTPSWLQNHIEVEDADVIAREDAESYVEGIDDERAVEEADMKEEWETAEADGDTKGMEAVVEKAKEAIIEKMSADKEKRMTDDPIQFFVHDEGIYTIEDLMKANFIKINIKEAAEDAVDTDGWHHFLSGYDSNYTETAGGMVIFRTN